MDFINRLTLKFNKILKLSVFFAVYLVVLWFSFSSKGIFVDGHFYKKSANMTTITYTCRNPFADFKKIILEKQVDGSVIKIDDSYTLTVNKNGDVSIADNTSIDGNLPDARWDLIANQSAESTRIAATHQPYFLVFIVYGLFALSRIYSAKVYEFVFRNRAAGESYYRIFNIVFTVITAAVMVYFILPV
ncbi:MAG: hypothetical protein IKA10_09600 [Oscillospiraceae bacterium]|nr:hypothetical protein [Oscillospiraceae bacterium]